METKKYSQFGTFAVISLGSALIFCIVIMIRTGLHDVAPVGILGFVVLTLLICLLIFYKLTITIDDTYIGFSLGTGLIAKKYLISDIQSCKSVRNNPIYGIGIRKIPGGWLYNVTGLNAIEIKFKNSKSIVRIGTNQPDEIAEIISKMIKIDQSGSDIDYKDRTGFLMALIIAAIAFLSTLILILSGNRDAGITLSKSGLKIKGMYGLTINYSDIKQLDTISELPRIKMRTNGYAFGKSLKGNFRFQNQENAKLFVTKSMPPYLLIRTDKFNVYLNFKESKKTVDLFKTLTAAQAQ
jgi:hypothetical protein